jgi:hypothetical protein
MTSTSGLFASRVQRVPEALSSFGHEVDIRGFALNRLLSFPLKA